MSWANENIDAKSEYKRLTKSYKELLKKPEGKNRARAIVYTAVLIVQLRNGSRVSEAIDALLSFIETGKREVFVRVRKYKTKTTTRIMIIPDEIRQKDFEATVEIYKLVEKLRKDFEKNEKRVVQRVTMFCKKKYGYSTHALRHAFITYHTRRGIPAQTLAKITRHQRIDHIITYTYESAAIELLRRGFE